jgi:hypothetical protein
VYRLGSVAGEVVTAPVNGRNGMSCAASQPAPEKWVRLKPLILLSG